MGRIGGDVSRLEWHSERFADYVEHGSVYQGGLVGRRYGLVGLIRYSTQEMHKSVLVQEAILGEVQQIVFFSTPAFWVRYKAGWIDRASLYKSTLQGYHHRL